MIRRSIAAVADPKAIVVGDRTPHTIIPVTLRNVPYISILRDGRDVLVSRAFHLFNHPTVHRLFDRIPAMKETLGKFQKDQWHFKKHPEDLLCHEVMVRESLRCWTQHLATDENAIELYPKLNIRFVRYEDLHKDTRRERAKLFEFLDVDPKLAGKIKGDLKPGFKTERPSEFFRKGKVGDWKNYISDQTKEWFKEEAGEQLIKYGYESSNDW
jgi:hypothetical protein